MLQFRTKSRKPAAFMNSVALGQDTGQIGANYASCGYNPGPGKYEDDKITSSFATEVIVPNNQIGESSHEHKAMNKAASGVSTQDQSSIPPGTYFTLVNGELLKRRQQWFSADRTKRFATDDPASQQYIYQIQPGPNQYSPRTTIADKRGRNERKRFAELNKAELRKALADRNFDPNVPHSDPNTARDILGERPSALRNYNNQ